MKKMPFLCIVLAFVFTLAGITFGENEFQIKGTVININGNKITIKGDEGGEITINSTVSTIKIGDIVLLKGEIVKVGSLRTTLTTQDVEFLTKQCQVSQADVDIIPQLKLIVQGKILKLVDARDCKKLTPFKASRDYYRQLRIDKPLPLPPAGWSGEYLTEVEFQRYVDILNNAPW